MAAYTGSNGTLWIKAPEAETWVDLGAVGFKADPVEQPSEAYVYPSVATSGSFTGTFRLHHKAWNQMCRVLNVPWLIVTPPSTPRRRRKHGGRWQSYRDVRAKWQAVRYD